MRWSLLGDGMDGTGEPGGVVVIVIALRVLVAANTGSSVGVDIVAAV